MLGQSVTIYGDGNSTRDFCFVDNVVQANLLAALTMRPEALNRVFNIGCGHPTSLNQLYQMLRQLLSESHPQLNGHQPEYADPRPGDIRHSFADISETQKFLGYAPTHQVADGLRALLRADI
jgi:UDP-N-acetylglucosamine 4-epimerase